MPIECILMVTISAEYVSLAPFCTNGAVWAYFGKLDVKLCLFHLLWILS